jgi:hypothetical protein
MNNTKANFGIRIPQGSFWNSKPSLPEFNKKISPEGLIFSHDRLTFSREWMTFSRACNRFVRYFAIFSHIRVTFSRDRMTFSRRKWFIHPNKVTFSAQNVIHSLPTNMISDIKFNQTTKWSPETTQKNGADLKSLMSRKKVNN